MLAIELIFLNFKAGFGDWRFTSYIPYFLYAWFPHFVCILDQVNKEILWRHEARGRYPLPGKENFDETHTPIQRVNYYISWSPSYRSIIIKAEVSNLWYMYQERTQANLVGGCDIDLQWTQCFTGPSCVNQSLSHACIYDETSLSLLYFRKSMSCTPGQTLSLHRYRTNKECGT